jgi:tetratricopeptide (TPR) repeat protein
MFQNDNKKRLEVNLKCKKIRQEVGDLEGVSSSEGNIGETYLEMGDFDNAVQCFNNVLNDDYSSVQGLAWAHFNLGRVAKENENWDQSLIRFQKALELSLSASYTVLITDSYLAIVELFVDQKRMDDALNHAEQALEVSRKIGAKEGEKMSLYYLSKIYEIKGEFETSLKYHKDYHTIDRDFSRDTEIERLKTAQLKVAFDKIEEQKNELVYKICSANPGCGSYQGSTAHAIK